MRTQSGEQPDGSFIIDGPDWWDIYGENHDVEVRGVVSILPKYSEDQPRDPAGTSTGGQFTSTHDSDGNEIRPANPVKPLYNLDDPALLLGKELSKVAELRPPPPTSEKALHKFNEHLADLRKLNEDDVRGLAAIGVKIVISGHETMADFKPELKGRPRGWPSGSWRDVSGGFDVATKTAYAGIGLGSAASLVLHETGHAIFRYGLMEQERKAFDTLWSSGVRKDKSINPYFRQTKSDDASVRAGANESFAEMFAEIRSGRTAYSTTGQAWGHLRTAVYEQVRAWNGRNKLGMVAT